MVLPILLNQYLHKVLDSVPALAYDVRAVRYGSGYILVLKSSGFRVIQINNEGTIIESDSFPMSDSLYGVAINMDGKPIAYGGTSSAFVLNINTSQKMTFPLPKFVDAVRTSNHLYLISYRNNTVFFLKDTSNYWTLSLPDSVLDVRIAYDQIGKKIYMLARHLSSLTLTKMDEYLNVLGIIRLTLPPLNSAYIDVRENRVVVGYNTYTSTNYVGVILLDTNLNTIRHFAKSGISLLSGVKIYGGKIYLYGTDGNPIIAILDTLGNTLSSVKADSIGNVRFLDPENGVAIYRANFKIFFIKSDQNFSRLCGMGSDSLANTTVPSLTIASPTYVLSGPHTVSPDTVTLSRNSYSPRYSTICSLEAVRVVFTQPDSGEVEVPLSANIGVWFSNEIDTTSVSGGVSIIGWNGSSFRSYTFSTTCPASNFCVLDPTINFRPNEEITVRFESTIQDTDGNPLIPKVIVFRTQVIDTSNPVVVFTTPDSGETNVPTNTKISVQFSKDIDTTTVSSLNITITGSSSGSHSFTKVCRTLSYCEINPSGSFTSGETVSVEFRSGIMGLNGRNLVPRTITFTVGSPDALSPTITIISDPDDTVRLYDPTLPIKAHVHDNYGIQKVEWAINSQTYITPTNCNGNAFNNPDTSCFYIPPLPTGNYKITAYAYDYAGNVGIDTAILKYQDTIKPRVVFTYPRDNAYGISPTPQITVVFSEGIDTTSGSLEIKVGSNTYSYTKYWQDLRTLKINPTEPLPYDSTVKVTLRHYKDLSDNFMAGDSFTFKFTIISNAEVFVRVLRVEPALVYKGSQDSTYILAEVISRYTIRGAKLVIDGSMKSSMFAKDGSFDEPVETVYVRFNFSDLDVGEHVSLIRSWNDYVERASDPFNISVKSIGFLDRENVVIYPNPTKGVAKLRIIFGGNTNASIEVFDLKVKRVFYKEESFEGFKPYEFVLPKLPQGVYLLRVKAGDKKVEKWFSVIR